MVRDLLSPVQLNAEAQQVMLEEVEEVFSDDDRKMLSMEPTLEETKDSIWNSNLTGSPGLDGILSLFYKRHWDLVGTLLYKVHLTNFRNKTLCKSQSEGLIMFSPKPKKLNSLKPSDKRRISLLNTDYKSYSSIPSRRLTKVAATGLSPYQYVAGGADLSCGFHGHGCYLPIRIRGKGVAF